MPSLASDLNQPLAVGWKSFFRSINSQRPHDTTEGFAYQHRSAHLFCSASGDWTDGEFRATRKLMKYVWDAGPFA